MRKIIHTAVAVMVFAVGGVMLPASAAPAPSGVEMLDPEVNPRDRDAIQRGAKSFVNYCLGCHSVKYLRYNRLGQDTGMPDDLVEEHLIFGEQEVHDLMLSSMDPEDAEAWLGMAPPDLSLTTRVEGEKWVYTFLNGFYRDEDATHGVNNLLQEGTSMPHMLSRLQGIPEPVYADDGETVVGVQIPEGAGGTLSEEEYLEFTADIVSFMVYAAEPIRADRERIGVWVILFLIVLTVIFYFLKREYWKDIH